MRRCSALLYAGILTPLAVVGLASPALADPGPSPLSSVIGVTFNQVEMNKFIRTPLTCPSSHPWLVFDKGTVGTRITYKTEDGQPITDHLSPQSKDGFFASWNYIGLSPYDKVNKDHKSVTFYCANNKEDAHHW